MSAVSRRNRRYNASLKAIDDYIGRQNGGGPADMLRFGLYRMRFNGCEVIAVYNLLHYLGGHRDIREIAEAFAEAGGAEVVFENPSDQEKKGYNLMTNSSLDSERLTGLGWKACFSLEEGTRRTVEELKKKDL